MKQGMFDKMSEVLVPIAGRLNHNCYPILENY